VSFTFDSTGHIAVVGSGGSGKDQLALLLARLMVPHSGTLTIGGARLADLPEAVTGRRIGYVGPNPYLFSTSVRDNLFYGLRHRPNAESDSDDPERKRYISEAVAAGNSTDDPTVDWIDYASAGAEDIESLTRCAIEVLSLVELEPDIYELGLRGTIDPVARADLAERFLEARREFLQRLSDPEIAVLVEPFDAEKYNDNATVGENLLFGSPVGDAVDMDRLAEHPYVLRVLDMAGLTEDFLETGRQVASTMVELFADLPPGHEFFEQFSFISHEDLPEYQTLLTRLGRDDAATLEEEERNMLLSLPFKLVPARHRLDAIDDAMKDRLLVARRMFAENLPAELAGAVESFDVEKYNAASSLQDNILFGKLAYGQARGTERVGALIAELVDNLGLRPAVLEVGLGFHVGIAGSRLLSAQRQKLALARSILKRPDIMVMNEAMTALDGASQVRVMERLLAEFKGRGVVWALPRASLARYFDHVIVMRGGRVVEQGNYSKLETSGSALQELIGAE
jgi:ABC-type cobalamin/Fe3+-siderophores transport system ATPase subunit